MLSVLNGDFEDYHYGSHVLIKFKSDNMKTITQQINEKIETRNDCASGYILGFLESNISMSDINTTKKFKEI